MKKNLFYLFALICSVSLFTACSDDDDDVASFEELNQTYTSTNLELTYGGTTLSGKSVSFSTTDGKTATIVLSGAAVQLPVSRRESAGGLSLQNPGVIPGEATTTLTVNLVSDGMDGYDFQGKDESNNRTIEYEGSVEKGELELDLKVTFSNELIGKWNTAKYQAFATSPIHCKWESSTPFSITKMEGLTEPWVIQPKGLIDMIFLMMQIPVGEESMAIPAAFNNLLQDVTFQADGNIVATYSDAANLAAPVWQTSPVNLAQYYVVSEGQMKVYLNVDAIMGLIMGSAQTKAEIPGYVVEILPNLMEFLPILKDGIPLGYTLAEDGSLKVFIQKEFGMKILGILSTLVQNEEFKNFVLEGAASDPTFGSFAPMVEEILDQIPGVITDTTEFELGLGLQKAE